MKHKYKMSNIYTRYPSIQHILDLVYEQTNKHNWRNAHWVGLVKKRTAPNSYGPHQPLSIARKLENLKTQVKNQWENRQN